MTNLPFSLPFSRRTSLESRLEDFLWFSISLKLQATIATNLMDRRLTGPHCSLPMCTRLPGIEAIIFVSFYRRVMSSAPLRFGTTVVWSCCQCHGPSPIHLFQEHLHRIEARSQPNFFDFNFTSHTTFVRPNDSYPSARPLSHPADATRRPPICCILPRPSRAPPPAGRPSAAGGQPSSDRRMIHVRNLLQLMQDTKINYPWRLVESMTSQGRSCTAPRDAEKSRYKEKNVCQPSL